MGIDEILEHAGELCHHVYAHHVIECAIEHGLPRQRQHVAHVLLCNLDYCVTDRHASYVIEKASKFCAAEDIQSFIAKITASSNQMENMAQNQYEKFVLSALCDIPGDHSLELEK